MPFQISTGPYCTQEQGWQGLAAQAVLQSQPGAGQGKHQCSLRPEHWAHSWGQAVASVGQAGLIVPWHSLLLPWKAASCGTLAVHMTWRQYLPLPRYEASLPILPQPFKWSGSCTHHGKLKDLLGRDWACPFFCFVSPNSPIFRLLPWSFWKMRVLPSWAATARTRAAAFWSCRHYLFVM